MLLCWLMLLQGASLYLRSWKTEKWKFFENSEKYVTYVRHLNITIFFKYYFRQFLPVRPEQLNFHLWCRFFSGFDKINNFQQQKQQVLFSLNMTPKCCRLKWCCRGPPHNPITAPNSKKRRFFGFSVENSSPCIGDLGGQKFRQHLFSQSATKSAHFL